MMKKNIYITLVLAVLLGLVGGFGSSYWMISNLDLSNSTINYTVDESSQMIEAQQAAAPGVVSIIQYINLQQIRQDSNNPFGDYMAPLGGENWTEAGGGTAFLINEDGVAITNKHVISDESGMYVAFLSDGTEFDVRVEAIDSGNDFAILQLIPPQDDELAQEYVGEFPYIELGDSAAMEVGQRVLAIGNALAEYDNTTTAGIISAMGRKIVASSGTPDSTSTLYGLIQTDAAINPGNSGGPLINLAGQAIGINTAVDSTAEGIGFAIPINDIKGAIESWELSGEIQRPSLGVSYIMINENNARRMNLMANYGALIVEDKKSGASGVTKGSAADEAGLKDRDVILMVDGEQLSFNYPLQDAILRYQVGDTITLTILRDKETFEVEVELTKAA